MAKKSTESFGQTLQRCDVLRCYVLNFKLNRKFASMIYIS